MSDPTDSLRALDAEFELGEALGRGAMGSVYRARERASGREVALKVLNASSDSAASRFLREGQVTAGLQHPGIVRIHSIGTLGGRPCLAYELVAGARSFEAAVKEDPSAAVPLLVQAGRALGAAHAAGLTHRDVKSENLLVDAEGRLRVSDFGLVTGEELSRLTQSGAWVGTPQTMAPEQFGDREAMGPPTDVWSLGVLLYWALVGRYPFGGAESMIALASAITAGDFQPPSRVREVPRGLEAVCLRALETSPEARYSDGDAFADALETAALGEEEVSSRWAGALAGGAVLVALIFGGAWLASSRLSETIEVSPEAPSLTPSPSQSALVALSPSPSAPPAGDAIPAGIMGWRPAGGTPLPPEILDHPYSGVESSFEHLLFAIKNGYGAESELRTARALLSGTGVQRDLEPALAILRHSAERDRRSGQVLLIETLAAEGRLEEELVWIGRLAQHDPRSFELHRLWRIARSGGKRSRQARAIWEALRPVQLRVPALVWLRGGSRRRIDAIRAEPGECSQFLVESLVEGWRREPGERADWDLGVALDNMEPSDQEALIAMASPSRRLARLCLRRRDTAHLERAIAPTLIGADEGWLLEVLEQLVEIRAAPPCALAVMSRLQASPNLAARRWVAVCRAQGYLLPRSQEGLRALRRLLEQGDFESGVLLEKALPKVVGLSERAMVLRPGARASHPPSLLATARLLLTAPGRPEEAAAVIMLRRAADAGHPPAQVAYSGWLRGSARTSKDLAKSYDYMAKAAEGRSTYALEFKGIYLRAGIGCRKSVKRGRKMIRNAARLGRSVAAERFGYLNLKEVPGEDSYQRAIRLTLAYDYLLRAVRQSGSPKARLGLALCGLKVPDRAEVAFKSLADLAAEDPAGEAATEYGKQLLERGALEQAEQVLERAAAGRTGALDALLGHWRATGRSKRAARYLEQGLAAKRPAALIVAARERFSTQRAWAIQTLEKLGGSRPQAHSVLADLLWGTGRRADRGRAYQLWLLAEARNDESAREALVEHDAPK